MRNLEQQLWPSDLAVDSGHDGQCFRMADGRHYVVTRTLGTSWPSFIADNRAACTRYIDEHPEDDIVVFDTSLAEQIDAASPIRYSERIVRLMRALIEELNGQPGEVSWGDGAPSIGERIARRSYLTNGTELRAALVHLKDAGLIELRVTSSSTHVKVNLRGLIAMEEDTTAVSSTSAFVAMWFGSEMSDVYDNAIHPAIGANGFEAIRVDRTEHNDKIDDRIVAEIRRSRFLVADFSCGEDGARGGVYYEAGFASGLGKPVIYTVREADLLRVHFDTRQFNHVVWKDTQHLRAALELRIAATIGLASG